MTTLDVGKAHQRIIRERKALEVESYPADIKTAECREISFEEASTIILEYEWLGTMGTTQTHFGIFFEGRLAGAICFGYFQALQGYAAYVGEAYAKKGIQLTRGACAHWAHPHSGSKLIGYGLREMERRGYKYVVAFSDPDAGEIGTLYQATNWHYLGTAGHAPHFDLYYKTGKLFLNDRDMFKKLGFCGKKKITEFLRERPDLEMRTRTDKARYMRLIGTKRENREMLSVLQPRIKPYPKRATPCST